MSISSPSPSRSRTRRARWVAALAALLAAATVWAPGTAAAAPAPAADRPARSAAAASVTLSPGDTIYSGWYRCTLGFNVTDGEDVYILTAGNCTSSGSYWYADPEQTIPIGPSVHSSFPGNDYGLIRYEDPGMAGSGDYVVASPYVGEQVHTTSSGTGIHTGTVTGLNATVNYGGGNIVYGLIRTNLCVESGVPGAPLLGDGRALGIGSGGSGTCATGATSFFQPLTEVLAALGLTLH